ncbi:hypothetical protein C7S15_6488 [Burkholderia cepacia]|nr:hypothetical protein [Burkholderia cepacia]
MPPAQARSRAGAIDFLGGADGPSRRCGDAGVMPQRAGVAWANVSTVRRRTARRLDPDLCRSGDQVP